MEYTREDHDCCYGLERPRRSHVGRFLRFWSAVIVTVLIVYGLATALLSMRPVAPEPQPEPVAEKLTLHRAFVIGCDATMAQRGAAEKWSTPSCYMRDRK